MTTHRSRRWRLVGRITQSLLWWPLLAVVGISWFFFGLRIARRLGLSQLAPAVGVMIAAAIVVTLWRWSAADSRRESILAGTCPRCYAAMTRFESRSPGNAGQAESSWRCQNCSLEETLT